MVITSQSGTPTYKFNFPHLLHNTLRLPVRTWINEGLEFLHCDDEIKKILQSIDVVYGQDKNIKSRTMTKRPMPYLPEGVFAVVERR